MTPKSCQKCNSSRIAALFFYPRDAFFARVKGKTYEGHNPGDMNVGDGSDTTKVVYCLECGQMQGQWPLKTTKIELGDSGRL